MRYFADRMVNMWRLTAVLLISFTNLDAQSGDASIDPEVFELQAFVVYGGIIDTIDGFTGEEYHRSNAVVEGFRQDFNKLLRGYHKKLLMDEYQHMQEQLNLAKQYEVLLKSLTEGFGISGFTMNHDNYMRIEKAIMNRLIKDPFFRIEALVVWELDKLKDYENQKPDSKYAADIRYNTDKQKWERRITTTWRVHYYTPKTGSVDVVKEQGLNLDTMEGFHFINRGLGNEVTSDAFRDVKLTYPIFVNSLEPVDTQVTRLRENFVEALFHIYDPFSWAWRRNIRFHKGFYWPIQSSVRSTRFRVKNRQWFEDVMINFLHDVATMRIRGVEDIYEQEMLTKIPVNNNILGTGFDLLNWNPGEDRSVGYNPKTNQGITINFNQPQGARFILIDAFRRWPGKLITTFQTKLAEQKRATLTGQELIKQVLEEVSGMPADIYIRKAAQAQKAVLEQHRVKL